MEPERWSTVEMGTRIREDLNLPMKEMVFQNIHFVSSTVHATRDLVDSIEKDVMDIRSTIREREQSRVDQQQLLALMKTENRALKEKVELLEMELDRAQQEATTELEERLSSLQAEMQRIAQQCSEALRDRNELALQLNHLEAQNDQLVAENQLLQRQLQEQTTAAVETPVALDPLQQQLQTITSRVAVLEAEAEVSRTLQQPSTIGGYDVVIAHPSAVPSPTPSSHPLTLDSRYLAQDAASRWSLASTTLPASQPRDLASPHSSRGEDDDDDHHHTHFSATRDYALQAHHITSTSPHRYGYQPPSRATYPGSERYGNGNEGEGEEGEEEDEGGRGYYAHGRYGSGAARSGLHGHSHGFELEDPADSYDDIQLSDVLSRDFR